MTPSDSRLSSGTRTPGDAPSLVSLPADARRVSDRILKLPLPISKNRWQRFHWSTRGRIKQAWHGGVWAWVNIKPRMERPALAVLGRV